MITAEYETQVLQERISALRAALWEAGADEGQLEQALRVEMGQMAGRMGDAAGPKDLSKAEKRATLDIKGHLATDPQNATLFTDSEKYPNWKWLYASPEVLVGIDRRDIQTDISGAAAVQLLREDQRAAPRGRAWVDKGKRGKQHIIQLNRIRVSRRAFRDVQLAIFARMGILRAACYSVAKKYVPAKRMPAWVEKRMSDAIDRHEVTELGMGSPQATIEATIKGKGLESNPRLIEKLARAAQASSATIQAKVEKLAKGAKYVFETGQAYFEKFDGGEE